MKYLKKYVTELNKTEVYKNKAMKKVLTTQRYKLLIDVRKL